PDCGGTLSQTDDKELTRFRCQTGHVYTGEKLLAGQTKMLEGPLLTAVRILKEKTVLARQLATRERQRGNLESAARFQDQSHLADRQSELIKKHVLQAAPLSSPEEVCAPLHHRDAAQHALDAGQDTTLPLAPGTGGQADRPESASSESSIAAPLASPAVFAGCGTLVEKPGSALPPGLEFDDRSEHRQAPLSG